MNFWRISKCGQEFLKIRRRMERGRLQLGCFSLLVAHDGAHARATSRSGLGWLAGRPTRGEKE